MHAEEGVYEAFSEEGDLRANLSSVGECFASVVEELFELREGLLAD